MATWLLAQASDQERRHSLRMQALPVSMHVTRDAPVSEPVRQHIVDGLLVHSAQSRARRSGAEEVLEETASSDKVQAIMLPLNQFQNFIVWTEGKCLHTKSTILMSLCRRPGSQMAAQCQAIDVLQHTICWQQA